MLDRADQQDRHREDRDVPRPGEAPACPRLAKKHRQRDHQGQTGILAREETKVGPRVDPAEPGQLRANLGRIERGVAVRGRRRRRGRVSGDDGHRQGPLRPSRRPGSGQPSRRGHNQLRPSRNPPIDSVILRKLIISPDQPYWPSACATRRSGGPTGARGQGRSCWTGRGNGRELPGIACTLRRPGSGGINVPFSSRG